ncbi:hypothetical protein [Thomasclavelia cocleata]|uniref:hypothetical protein n=1 Tax=Thomasclavelia cocleata TaxID=69824 RepID=UPI00272DD6BD|nr:hypothetical protein [Thomasclavelia cocleata]
MNKLEISPTDKLVFVKAVIENIDSNEEIGKYFNYSESGLRNRVNIILKQLINIILKEESN